MLDKTNIVKAIIVCAIVMLLHTFYITATDLQSVLFEEGQDVSKIEAFTYFISYVEVWIEMFFIWAYDFFLSFTVCILLLRWLKK